MTPAIDLIRKKKINHQLHQYAHNADAQSYGLEAAQNLAFDPNSIFKTLVVELNNKELVVGLVPVSMRLSLKGIAKALGEKKASMADAHKVQNSTGYLLGGVSPLGQKKKLRTVIDSIAQEHSSICISAGRRGLEIELAPSDLQQLSRAIFSSIAIHRK